ncbi:hypothetical protein F442_13505 [Phytophthora nicotianae P10297]|uniref:Uncharacterized protein n=1 Tax=Phytophthora nicotianae P10297 TaxID=1317064 RepID=W2YYF9_PHYNI|nr:hypothetical protein F442_13505 [Phytophthora nicotianae P10297]
MPNAGDQVPRKCPHSGVDKLLTVETVVDFAFYKDGNRAIPASVNIGDTYSDVIESRQNQRRNNARPTVLTHLSLVPYEVQDHVTALPLNPLNEVETKNMHGVFSRQPFTMMLTRMSTSMENKGFVLRIY